MEAERLLLACFDRSEPQKARSSGVGCGGGLGQESKKKHRIFPLVSILKFLVNKHAAVPKGAISSQAGVGVRRPGSKSYLPTHMKEKLGEDG